MYAWSATALPLLLHPQAAAPVREQAQSGVAPGSLPLVPHLPDQAWAARLSSKMPALRAILPKGTRPFCRRPPLNVPPASYDLDREATLSHEGETGAPSAVDPAGVKTLRLPECHQLQEMCRSNGQS